MRKTDDFKGEPLTFLHYKNMKILSYEKLKTGSFCVGVCHFSSTVGVDSDIAKTDQKTMIGKCIKGFRKKEMAVSDEIFQAEEISHAFENKSKTSAKTVQKLILIVLKNPGKPLNLRANNGSAAVGIRRQFHLLPRCNQIPKHW